MQDHTTDPLPLAWRGLLAGRPLVVWSLVGGNLAIWLSLAALLRHLLAG